jgi:arylsulfatase A-like enzyme
MNTRYLLCGILLALLSTHSSQAAASKPNIILILADDLGWSELSFNGNTINETPNLDKLASQGLRFTQHYAAAPVCSPTRASIVTGCYPSRTGIGDFLPAKTDKWLDPRKWVTINEMLGQAGYYTCEIGKWHLDTDFVKNPGGPMAHRYDEVIGTETKYIADGDYFFPYDKISTFESGKEGEYLTDRLSDEAVAFLRRRKTAQPNRPFLLQLNHYAVHTVLAAPRDKLAKYKAKYDAIHGVGSAAVFHDPSNKRHEGKPHNPYLAALTEVMDAGVGRIMAALDELGMTENTIVIFTSDNGGDNAVADNAPLRSGKTWLYEGGIREPQIIRWPGVVKPGQTSDAVTCTVDYYKTFAEIAGTQLPTGQPNDGISLVSLLRDGKAPARDALFWNYPADTAPWPKRAAVAVRLGDYKLIEFTADRRRELYDLKNDTGESKNLLKDKPDIAARLETRLKLFRNEVKPR